MRGVRFTKAEVMLVQEMVDMALHPPDDPKVVKLAKSVLAKLEAASEPAAPGVSPGPIEQALVASSRGKVVPVGSGYARLSKQATQVGATVDDAKLIGAWMARTGWLTGPKTLFDVLNQWPNWLAKAKATSPPPSAPSGFGEKGDGGAEKDGTTQSGTSRPSQGAPGRLRPGFKG